MIRIIAVGVKLVLRPLNAAPARMDVVYVTDENEFNAGLGDQYWRNVVHSFEGVQ
jgi:hypothetical protein